MELVIKSKKYGEFTCYYDDEDHDLVSKYKWFIRVFKYRNYAIANQPMVNRVQGSAITMHRLIMGFPKDLEVDHKDFNGLNNMKYNLRIGTHAQNNMNKRPQTSNTTGYKGVHFDKSRKLYQVYIDVNNKRIRAGRHKDILEAAKMYNELAIKYHGEFAYLNKIP